MNTKTKIFALGIALIVATLSTVAQTPAELARYTGATLPTPTPIPDQLIVKISISLGFNASEKSQVIKTAKSLGAKSIRIVDAPEAAGRFVGSSATLFIQFNPGLDIETIQKKLQSQPDVIYVEPVYPLELFGKPNDPGYPFQAYLTQGQLSGILSIPANHDISIAIIDTGIGKNHPDLVGHVGEGKNWVSSNAFPSDNIGHGTHLAGIIAAVPNNRYGVVGLNPKATIIPLKIFGDDSQGSQLDAAEAIRYAVGRKVKIIVCSWGYFLYNQVLKEAVDYALSKGVLVVAAAGNHGSALKQYPAGFPGVIAVGSLDNTGTHASFSDVGDHIAFVESGVNITGLGLKSALTTWSGTSQSAAIVAGIASRVLAYNPSLSGTDVGTLLMLSTETVGDVQKSAACGHGRIVSEKLCVALNVSTANGIIGEDGTVVAESIKSESTDKSEPLWMTITLLPFRIIEMGAKLLF